MVVADQVRAYLEKLPPPLQAEVLHYVEFLWERFQSAAEDEDQDWQRFSLASALRDMDMADEMTYRLEDLEERF